ncbi:hypothetical protein HELRODRAFT_125059, partial [Helobdella robusta]|uniref:Runt domain-containing protein n=1 Tax=Helobdella robusta TaxID=6412 RepID=T1EH41_HELRO
IATGCPHIFCTSLPKHWRANKSLPNMFRLYDTSGLIRDGTRVKLFAGNEDNSIANLRNNESTIVANSVVFNDLRFIGRSGRGKFFLITIVIMSEPMIVATYSHAIKVTVDGPREPRCKS